MVTQNHDRMILYVVAATLGSLTGCLVMYFLGSKGGEALLRKRFASATVDRAMAAFERYGVLVVLIPAILPPPAPFKIFVLLSGVAGISLGKFVTAIVIGRGARYLTLGILAIRYGEQCDGVHGGARGCRGGSGHRAAAGGPGGLPSLEQSAARKGPINPVSSGHQCQPCGRFQPCQP